MKTKISLIVILLLACPLSAFGADVTLNCDTVSTATGYKIQMSIDKGTTWQAEQDTPTMPYIFKNVPDTGLVLFRIAAYNAQSKTYRYEAGAWYCGDWKPILQPTGVGIK